MKISIGLYNQVSKRAVEYQDRLRLISLFHLSSLDSQYELDRKYIEGTNVESILEQALEKESDYIIILSYGLRIFDRNLLDKTVDYCQENSYRFAGHILIDDPKSESKYFSMHRQYLCIHLPTLKKINCTSYGLEHEIVTENLHYPIVSKEHLHDNYTPTYLKPSGKKKLYNNSLREGFRLISAFLDNGYEVGNFNWGIRNSKEYLYPEDDFLFEKYIFDKSIKLNNQSQLNWVNGIAKEEHLKKSFFYFNTDKFLQYPDLLSKKEKVNRIYTVAAGFFDLHLLKQTNFDELTEIVHMDFSKTAIKFKQELLRWDGKNYFLFLKNFLATNECYKALGNTIEDFNLNSPTLEFQKYWKYIIEYFGGEREWLKFFNKYKSCKHTHRVLNIVEDYNKLLEEIKSNNKTERYDLVWFSNSYNTAEVGLYYSSNSLNKSYTNLTEGILSINSKNMFIGSKPILLHEYTR